MNRMRKTICAAVAAAMLTAGLPALAADGLFPDVPETHWAYTYVDALVQDGTVGGYEDGTFKPSNGVTRAAFVKMAGKTETAFSAEFADVPAGHWAYEYVMYSGMEVEGSYFYPDRYITRGEVVALLWSRAGKPAGGVVPAVISGQGDNPEAVAWAYSTGLLQGDDGITLRLGDGLTRAEGAALIYRSRQGHAASYAFDDVVDETLLRRVFEGANLFDDSSYRPERTFTNGEIAKAVVRLASEQYFTTYYGLHFSTPFEGEYVRELSILGNYVLSGEVVTEAFHNAAANRADTLAGLLFAVAYKARGAVVQYRMDQYYPDVEQVYSDKQNMYLTECYLQGIRLDGSDMLQPERAVTAKDLAFLLLQLDSLAGINSKFVIKNTEGGSQRQDVMLRTAIGSYPSAADNYMYILDEVPNAVYDRGYVDQEGQPLTALPKDAHRFAREYSTIFVSMLEVIRDLTYSYDGTNFIVTYYPSLVCADGNGYTMRVKIEMTAVQEGAHLDDVFPNTVSENPALDEGMVFWADIATGQPVLDMTVPADEAVMVQVLL